MESLREATLNDKEQIYGLLVALEETNIDTKQFSDIFDANISNLLFTIMFMKRIYNLRFY